MLKQLRDIIKASDLSRQAIAEQAKVSKTLVTHIANGGGCTIDKAARIAKACGYKLTLQKGG